METRKRWFEYFLSIPSNRPGFALGISRCVVIFTGIGVFALALFLGFNPKVYWLIGIGLSANFLDSVVFQAWLAYAEKQVNTMN